MKVGLATDIELPPELIWREVQLIRLAAAFLPLLFAVPSDAFAQQTQRLAKRLFKK